MGSHSLLRSCVLSSMRCSISRVAESSFGLILHSVGSVICATPAVLTSHDRYLLPEIIIPGQSNQFMAHVDHVVEPAKLPGLDTTGLRQSGLLALRRAEIGDGEIETPLRLPKFTPAMFDSVP